MHPTIPAAPAPAERRTRWWIAAIVAGLVLFVLFGCAGAVVLVALGQGGPSDLLGGDSVALIHIDAPIGGTAGGAFDYSVVTPEGIIDQLDQAEEDDSVKAVLLRIDSSGGTASASQEIAMEVRRMRKPVVASIGDVGASGAYMIASQCDEVVASPFSAVGSIGVITEFANLRELADKLGIKLEVIAKGKYKDAGNPFRDLTPRERELIEREVTEVYDEFIRDVARGRKLPDAKVRELATGWVWNGRRAKELGLVDTIGNYSDAVRAAGKKGGIKGEPRIVTYDEPALSDLFGTLVSTVSRLGRVGSIPALEARPPLVK